MWGLLKQAYTECYLRMEDARVCDKWVGFPFSPWMGSQEQFEQLRLRKVSLYSDAFAAELRILPVDFDPVLYLEANPDVARIRMNPIEHYVMAGKDEGRKLRP